MKDLRDLMDFDDTRCTLVKGVRPNAVHLLPYISTSLTRNRPTLGPYRRPVPRVLGGS